MEELTIQEITEAVHGTLLCGDPQTLISYVSIDSRDIRQQTIFTPIIGARVDAHKFIKQVFEAGAAASFTSEGTILDVEKPHILVENTEQALIDLAIYYRARFSIPVVGVTGSVGKTSTKEMIAAALETKYRVLKTAGNYNSTIGVPLMIFQMDPSYEIAVLEMGISHFGEMDELVLMVQPQTAAVTNIGVAHIANLGTQEHIRSEKLKVAKGFTAGRNVLFLNGNDPMLYEAAAAYPGVARLFGHEEEDDTREPVQVRTAQAADPADMDKADTVRADMDKADMDKADMDKADTVRADMDKTDTARADMNKAGTDMAGTNRDGFNRSGTDRNRRYPDTQVCGAALVETCLRAGSGGFDYYAKDIHIRDGKQVFTFVWTQKQEEVDPRPQGQVQSRPQASLQEQQRRQVQSGPQTLLQGQVQSQMLGQQRRQDPLPAQTRAWQGQQLWPQTCETEVKIRQIGLHNVNNAVVALAIALQYGIDPDTAKAGVETYEGLPMRQQICHLKEGIKVIDDTYNASPDSIKSGIEVLKLLDNPGDKIAVLADVLELGEMSYQCHYETGVYVADSGITEVVAVGKEMRALAQAIHEKASGMPVRCFDRNEEAAAYLRKRVQPGDALLVKGSRGMHLEEIVAALKEAFA